MIVAIRRERLDELQAAEVKCITLGHRIQHQEEQIKQLQLRIIELAKELQP